MHCNYSSIYLHIYEGFYRMADMAGEVHITGTDLPQWASEMTLGKLLETVEKLTGISQEQKKSLDKAFREIQKTGKATPSGTGGATGGKSKGGKNTGIAAELTSGLSDMTSELSGTSKGLDHLSDGPMKVFGKGLKGLSKKMGLLGGFVAIIAGQAGAALKTFTETVSVFRQFAEVGITVNQGIVGFQRDLSNAGMTMEHMAEITSKYTRTVGNIGIRAIVDMTVAAEEGGFAFAKYSLTLDEAVEYQTDLLETQRLGGIFRIRDEKAHRLALQENVKRFTAYSKILNTSREDMMASRKEVKGRADVMRMFNSMPEDMREASNKSFDQLTTLFAGLGPDAKGAMDMLVDIIANPAGMAADSFTELARVSPELANQFMDLRQRVLDGEDIGLDEIENFAGVLDVASKSGQLNMLALGKGTEEIANMLGGPFLNALRNAEVNIAKYAEEGGKAADTAKTMAEAQNENVVRMTKFQDEMNQLHAKTEYARIAFFEGITKKYATDILEGATRHVDQLGNAIQKFGDDPMAFLKDMWANIIDKFSRHVIEPMMNKIGDFVASITGFIDKIKNMAANMWKLVVDTFKKRILGMDIGVSAEVRQIRAATAVVETTGTPAINIKKDLLDRAVASGSSEDIKFRKAEYDLAVQTLATSKLMLSELRGRALGE